MITCELDYKMFKRLCKSAAYFDNDNEDYISLLYDYYENTNINDAALFFDNLAFNTKYFSTLDELVNDIYSAEDYVIYEQDENGEDTDVIDESATYENLKENSSIDVSGNHDEGYIVIM